MPRSSCSRMSAGEQREVVHRRPRGVREVSDAQVGPQLTQHPRHQTQVVVLDEDRRAVRRVLGQRLRERPVVGLVRRPLTAELRVEGGLQRRLVEQVVDEPQHGVGDAVVGVLVHVGRNGQHAHALLADAAPHRLPVAVGERRAHPEGARLGPDGRQAGDQPAAAAFRVQRAVLAHLVGDRTAVGRDQHLGGPGGSVVRGSHTPNLARSGNAQTYGRAAWTGRIRPCRRGRRHAVYGPSGTHATLRVAYSAISAIGGRSSVSTEYVRGSKPSALRSNWVRDGRIRCPRASRSWAVR